MEDDVASKTSDGAGGFISTNAFDVSFIGERRLKNGVIVAEDELCDITLIQRRHDICRTWE